MAVPQKTINLLAAETGNDAEDAEVGYPDNIIEFYRKEYMVFPSYNAAERYAVNYVKDMLEDDPGMFSQDWLTGYMKANDIHAFASDAGDAAYEDAEYSGEDPDEAYEEAYNRVESELKNDPVSYFADFGMSVTDAYEKGFLGIDVRKAAQDAVDTDGVEHFLARYDGNEIDLENGAYAYRIN